MDQLETVENDLRPATQEACGVCGETEFYAEAGHYYCSVCNTQSQSARIYVDENFIPERALQTRAAILRDKETSKSKEEKKEYLVSSWEMWNVVLKKICDWLVELGFPGVIKNKVLHLYAAFLIRRGVIFVSKANPEAKSTITIGEPTTNIRALYGKDYVPPMKVRASVRRKRRAKARAQREEGGDDNADADQEYISRAQKKAKVTRTKRKAIEQEYLTTEAAEQAREDAEFERALSQPTSSGQTPPDTKERKTSMKFTKGTRIVKRSLLKGVRLNKMIPLMNRQNLKTKAATSYRKARNLLKHERFTYRSCLILVYVALRQLGFPVVVSDMLRLMRCGVLHFDVLQLLHEYEQYQDVHYISSYFYKRLFQKIVRMGEDTEIFIKFIGIKRFFRPKIKEIVPKYMEDFVLPREFECLANLLNHMYSEDELLKMASCGPTMKNTLSYNPEVFVLAQIVVLLRMLFGMDDQTEKYQSEFAKLVNKVMREEAAKHGLQMQDWTECFVIEDWFHYLRRRDDLVKREINCPSLVSYNRPPSISKLSELMKRKCCLEEDHRCTSTRQEKVRECADVFKNALYDRLPPANVDHLLNNPNWKPYVPLPLPNESIVQEYLERCAQLNDPSVKTDSILPFLADFERKRIDFILKPKRYVKLLRLCGYDVKIVKGDAVSNFPKEKLKDGTILVFQPYKKFVEYIGRRPEKCSNSLQFVLSIVDDILLDLNQRINLMTRIRHSFLRVVEELGRSYVSKVLSNHIPVLTRWDPDDSDSD